MNWYKQSQENEWHYEGAEHNYDPNWDYEEDTNTDQEIVQFINNFINEIKRDLLPKIEIIKDIKVAYIKDQNDTLSRYIDGTSPYAVIVIDIENIKEGIKRYGGQIGDAIEMTILHEIGHAAEDVSELEYDEQNAEEFAFQYQVNKKIYKFWEF